jgi:hypothetical protein
MRKPRIHKLPDGSEISNVDLCRRVGVPVCRSSGLTTSQVLNFHNRKKKVSFSLDGKTATAAQWAAALKVTPNIFRDTVYSCERAGGTREQAMLATIKHLGGGREPLGAIEQLRKIQERERPTASLA